MKANELRIGNYYIDVCGLSSEWKESSFQHYKLAKVKLSELKPIPLTDKKLLKFGFKEEPRYKTNGMNCFVLNNFILLQNKDGGYNLCDIDIKVTLEYVHTLQNLYFALKGNELKNDM